MKPSLLLRISRALPRLREFSIADPISIGVLVLFCATLWLYPRSAVIEDFWYHLALGHWIAEHGQLFLNDPISFQPFGRPQLYPLFMHSIIAAGEWITGSAITGSIVVRIAIYVGNLAAVWWAGRRLISPMAGYLAVVLLATDQALFYASWSLMPAGLVGLFIVLLVLTIESRRWVAVSLLLAMSGYSHLTMPWLVLVGLLLVAWARPELRRSLLRSIGVAVLLMLPFLLFILSNLGSFYAEKAVNFNPIPGLGPFGYASHYHLDSLLFFAGAMGAFHVVLPQRRLVATLLGLMAALSPVLIGIEDLPAKLWRTVQYWTDRFNLHLLDGAAPSLPWLHPMTLLNIGTAFAIVCLVSFLILGLRRIAPGTPIAKLDAVLAGFGSVVLIAGAVLAFHVEVTAYRLWDGIALGADVALVTVIVSLLLWPFASRSPLHVRVLAASCFGLGITLPLMPVLTITVEPQTFVVGAAALVLAGLVGLGGYVVLRWIARRDATHRSPLSPGMTTVLCVLIALLPMLPTYGGRFFWHTGGLLALLAVSSVTREHRLVRAMFPLQLMFSCYLLMALLVYWPLFSYSRGWRREFLSQPPPFFMATASEGPTEYEDQNFLDLISWVREHTPAGEIVHTDDPRIGHMLFIFTDRVSDVGMFWEAQTKALNDAVQVEREKGIGLYVYTGALPPSVTLQHTFGKWKVSYQPPLPSVRIEDSSTR